MCQKEAEIALECNNTRLQKENGDLEARGRILLCFHWKVITLAQKGGCGETPSILLEARIWLMMPDDKPLQRDGTHHPKTGNTMFAGRIYPSDQEDAKLKFERERKSFQEKYKTRYDEGQYI